MPFQHACHTRFAGAYHTVWLLFNTASVHMIKVKMLRTQKEIMFPLC